MRKVFLVMAGVLAVLCLNASLSHAGTVELVSVDSNGSLGNSNSRTASMSADGRYVAFSSWASNLVLDDTNGTRDIFVHDRVTGITERVSVDSYGNQANGRSYESRISADGRYVVFTSFASNLVPVFGTNSPEVYLHDRETGITERVCINSNGDPGNSWSINPSISADGRYVAFASSATNLVPNDTNGHYDIFVHDMETGVTERVSVDSNGNQAVNEYCGCMSTGYPSISADGRYVAFHSDASNLVPGSQNALLDVYVHDRVTGITELISYNLYGNQGNNVSKFPSISDDGRYVAFHSWARYLVDGDTNGVADIFVRDRETGNLERVSIDDFGNQANGHSYLPTINSDGRYVAFTSRATNLVPDDTNGAWGYDVFLYDRETGITERINVDSFGNQANSSSYYAYVETISISADGRSIAFESGASNLVPNDINETGDIFVHDSGPLNAPPVADAGADVITQCISPDGTPVVLDGSGSSDPDGDPLSYEWTEGAAVLAADVVASVIFDLGAHSVTLNVSDGVETASDIVEVTVYATVAGLSELVNGYAASGDISDIVAQDLLGELEDAQRDLDNGDYDKAIQDLDQFKKDVDSEKDKGNIPADVAAVLAGAADCVIGVIQGNM
jgi:Tol biopolymer transport system component